VKGQRILAIAPHTDDIELGCGATLHNLKRHNISKIYCQAYSHIYKHPEDQTTTIDLADEWEYALGVLNIDDHSLYNFPTREFEVYRQEILQKLCDTDKVYKPDLVIVPCRKDIHQDHSVITREAIRAFRKSSIIGYILPWSMGSEAMNPQLYVPVSEEDIEAKERAWHCFKSQSSRSYNGKIRSWAQTFGSQIGADYAEAFEVIRWIL